MPICRARLRNTANALNCSESTVAQMMNSGLSGHGSGRRQKMHGSRKCCGELAELTVDEIWQIADAQTLATRNFGDWNTREHGGKAAEDPSKVGHVTPSQYDTFRPNFAFFTALHGMQTLQMHNMFFFNNDEISVCPSVRLSDRLSNACIVTKRKKNLSRFLNHTKDHSVSFYEQKNGWWGATPST